MLKMNRAARIALLFSFLVPDVAAQVRVNVPSKTYKLHERIVAVVTNSGRKSVTVCVEVSQTSQIDDETKSTPYPFAVQRKSQNKWNTLLIGPDVGSFRKTDVLKPGESLKFPFALNTTGQIRLLLEFWNLEN